MTESKEKTLGERIDSVRAKLATYRAEHYGKQVWILCGSDDPLWAAGIRNLDGAILEADDSLELTDWKDMSKNQPLRGGLMYFTLTDPNSNVDDDDLEDW